MKKRRISGVLLVALLAVITPQTAFGALGGKSTTQVQTEKSYEFLQGTTRIALNQEADPIVKSLGKAVKTFEQDSCAFQGKDTIYTYENFELAVYTVNGKNLISSVYFLNDKAETEEGIKIGSSYQDVIKAYGKDYKTENDVYRYVKGGTELAFYVTNNKVDAIEYIIAAK